MPAPQPFGIPPSGLRVAGLRFRCPAVRLCLGFTLGGRDPRSTCRKSRIVGDIRHGPAYVIRPVPARGDPQAGDS